MDKFIDSFAEPLVLVAFLNFAGIAISGFFSWQASKLAQKSINASQVNTQKIEHVTAKVETVKQKVNEVQDVADAVAADVHKIQNGNGK